MSSVGRGCCHGTRLLTSTSRRLARDIEEIFGHKGEPVQSAAAGVGPGNPPMSNERVLRVTRRGNTAEY
jgi:hypothetical protein